VRKLLLAASLLVSSLAWGQITTDRQFAQSCGKLQAAMLNLIDSGGNTGARGPTYSVIVSNGDEGTMALSIQVTQRIGSERPAAR
jgi:hypothetical protein